MNNKAINEILKNKVNIDSKNYTGILGSSPSKGARSPILWNAVYESIGMDCRMYPFDVELESLDNLLSLLMKDKFFLGGSITIPYKEVILKKKKFVNIDERLINIGSVNCFYKLKNNHQFIVENSDSIAALECFKKKYGDIKNKKVLMLGYGGVGKSIAKIFSDEGAKIMVSCRKSQKYIGKKKDINFFDWNNKSELITQADIIINATDIGFDGTGKGDLTPLVHEDLKKVKKTTIIFDVIYKSNQTNFIKLAKNIDLKVIDGACMNLHQAIIGFCKCHNCFTIFDRVKEIMLNKKNEMGW